MSRQIHLKLSKEEQKDNSMYKRYYIKLFRISQEIKYNQFRDDLFE